MLRPAWNGNGSSRAAGNNAEYRSYPELPLTGRAHPSARLRRAPEGTVETPFAGPLATRVTILLLFDGAKTLPLGSTNTVGEFATYA